MVRSRKLRVEALERRNLLAGVPVLYSDLAAPVKVFLDFNGRSDMWADQATTTLPYDTDSNPGDFSPAEVAAITEIWQRVSEDFAPLRVNVTTIDPTVVDPTQPKDLQSLVVAIGTTSVVPTGYRNQVIEAEGAFFQDAFFRDTYWGTVLPNIGFVFAPTLGNDTRLIAEAVSHNAGHQLGLHDAHQFAGSVDLGLDPGSGDYAPIMGNTSSPAAVRTTWANGKLGPNAYQVESQLKVFAASSRLGARADDVVETMTWTTPAIPETFINSGIVNFNGMVGLKFSSFTDVLQDKDVFALSTVGGPLNLQVTTGPFTNLDSVMELRNSFGELIVSSAPGGSYDSSISTVLSAGRYYIVVTSMGDYGDMGRYNLSGTIPPKTALQPEINFLTGTTSLVSGALVQFDTTTMGNPVTRTITIKNEGGLPLNLKPITSVPVGFSLDANIGATTLAPLATTSFTITATALGLGTYSGQISIPNDDANENPYVIRVDNIVIPEAPLSVTVLDDGDVGFTTVGKPFGVLNVGYQGDARIGGQWDGLTPRYAQWTVSGLTPGVYKVWATWPGKVGSNGTNAALYSLYDDATLISQSKLAQRSQPYGLYANGTSWSLVNGEFNLTSTTAVVRLDVPKIFNIEADAVRFELVQPAPMMMSAAAYDEALMWLLTDPSLMPKKSSTLQN